MNQFNHKDGNVLNNDTASIYFEEIENSKKPVLLLLHGGFGNIEDFNVIISKLKNEFRIIGIDSRGQGKSTIGNKTLSYELLQNDAEQILKHLDVSELSILGFSDGGIVAYRLAAFSKLKINKLITIGARWHKSNVAETKNILGAVDAKKWRVKFPEMVSAYERQNPNKAPMIERGMNPSKKEFMSSNSTTHFAPQLIIPSGTSDISFYQKAFGANEHFILTNDDGTVHVAEFSIDDALFHVHEEKPSVGHLPPPKAKGITTLIGLFVEDVDAVYNRAVAAGGVPISPPTTYEYNYRQAQVKDPFAHIWLIEKKL